MSPLKKILKGREAPPDVVERWFLWPRIEDKNESVLIELRRVGGDKYHYVAYCYDPKKDEVLEGVSKSIAPMELDAMRSFAMGQTTRPSTGAAWYRVCTEETPWDGRWRNAGGVIHAEVREIPGSQADGWPAGDTVMMRCPVCDKTWETELPQ